MELTKELAVYNHICVYTLSGQNMFYIGKTLCGDMTSSIGPIIGTTYKGHLVLMGLFR